MKKQILLLCLALTSLCSYAQTITVKGVVTSASDKEPMIGATVQVKGTGTGTITSIDGDYSLNDVAKDAVLVFSSIGYETQEIKVNGQTVINVVLKDASELLDEVVVIGYGAVKKSDLTSSISTVKGKEITETVTGNAMDALQGKINGVQVTSGGGPGAQPKVLIRGVTTVNGTDPLYVVDGMPVGTNINFLNSNDIESMEVLKDASAAAIYGTRASNGVILITTKKGMAGKTNISFNASAGFQTLSKPKMSRRKLLEKISVEDMPASSRRYPWVGFKAEREPGKDRLFVTDISKTVDGEKLLNHVSFIVGKEDKIAILGKNELAVTMLFKILMGDEEPDEGTVKWGVSTTQAYFPKDHNSYFENCDYDLIDWMRQFSTDKRESYLRTFLGRMLFSGDDVYKQVKVLSGGEKVRCMISKMMLSGANFLVFDQPTNHLDLESIAALNNGMAAFPYNIIFTSHDHQLTQTVANRIIEITPDGIIDRRCTYDEYMHIAGQEAE